MYDRCISLCPAFILLYVRYERHVINSGVLLGSSQGGPDGLVDRKWSLFPS